MHDIAYNCRGYTGRSFLDFLAPHHGGKVDETGLGAGRVRNLSQSLGRCFAPFALTSYGSTKSEAVICCTLYREILWPIVLKAAARSPTGNQTTANKY